MDDNVETQPDFFKGEVSTSAAKTNKGKFVLSPFVRLSRVHALSAAGDAMITVALAGSLFFSIDPSAARWRVGLYLALTIAPFAVVSPLIGPIIDRYAGGRRLMILAINILRVITAALMVSNLDSLFLFPLAFTILVLQKSYAIAKAAVVPTTVETHEQLVEKNARLAFLSGISGFCGAAPAALAQLIGGPGWSVVLAAITFGFAGLASLRLPKTTIAPTAEQEDEKEELRSAGITRAATSMGVLRGIIGFFTFLVAFAYRGGTDDLDLSGIGTATGSKLHEDLLATDIGADGSSAIALGAVVACSVIGGLIGSIIAPKIRTRISEERMLLGALLTITSIAILGLWAGGISGALVVGLAVGLSVSSGKLAFDSIVQRDAPDANYGRSFARFETRFQLIWVFAALIPVVFTPPARLGFLMLAIAGGTAAITYLLGNNSGTQQTTEGILGLLKNLIQKPDIEEQPKIEEPPQEQKAPVMEKKLEPFNPFPQDPEDDNFKLF